MKWRLCDRPALLCDIPKCYLNSPSTRNPSNRFAARETRIFCSMVSSGLLVACAFSIYCIAWCVRKNASLTCTMSLAIFLRHTMHTKVQDVTWVLVHNNSLYVLPISYVTELAVIHWSIAHVRKCTWKGQILLKIEWETAHQRVCSWTPRCEYFTIMFAAYTSYITSSRPFIVVFDW